MSFLRVAVYGCVFAIIGIFFGYGMDYIFPPPTAKESVWSLFGLALAQIVFGILLTYSLALLFNVFTGHERDEFFEITVFVLVFFLVQNQLFERLRYLFQRLSLEPLP